MSGENKWLESLKKGFNTAADATKKAGRTAVLKADREVLLRKQKNFMKEFGVEVFPAMDKDDKDLVQTIFLKYKGLIDEVQMKLDQNNKEMAQINEKPEAGVAC